MSKGVEDRPKRDVFVFVSTGENGHISMDMDLDDFDLKEIMKGGSCDLSSGKWGHNVEVYINTGADGYLKASEHASINVLLILRERLIGFISHLIKNEEISDE